MSNETMCQCMKKGLVFEKTMDSKDDEEGYKAYLLNDIGRVEVWWGRRFDPKAYLGSARSTKLPYLTAVYKAAI